MTRGGPRKPGPGKKLGRPPTGEAKVPFSGRCSKEVDEFVRANGGYSKWIEATVRKLKKEKGK